MQKMASWFPVHHGHAISLRWPLDPYHPTPPHAAMCLTDLGFFRIIMERRPMCKHRILSDHARGLWQGLRQGWCYVVTQRQGRQATNFFCCHRPWTRRRCWWRWWRWRTGRWHLGRLALRSSAVSIIPDLYLLPARVCETVVLPEVTTKHGHDFATQCRQGASGSSVVPNDQHPSPKIA